MWRSSSLLWRRQRTIPSVYSIARLGTTRTLTTTTTHTRSSSKPLFNDLSNLFSASEQVVVAELSLNPYELHRHGRGESFHPTQPPDLVVYPQHTDHVVRIVQYAAQHGIPLIPFGVGTSLEGHVAAVKGGICIDMTRMNQMELLIHSSTIIPDPFVTVGAGMTRKQLNQALR
jgi:D-lactate dehydrogenase (cytochrome)